MKWFVQFFRRGALFIEEVRVELHKSTWPDRGELIESTIVVILSVVLLSMFVGVSDTILGSLVRFMVG